MTTLATGATSLQGYLLYSGNNSYLLPSDSLTAGEMFAAFTTIRQCYEDYYYDGEMNADTVVFYDEHFHVNDVFSDHMTIISLEGDFDWPFMIMDEMSKALALHGWTVEPYNAWSVTVNLLS